MKRWFLTFFSLTAVAALVACLALGWRAGVLPTVVLKAYACMSLLSWVAYAIDKATAVGGRRRLSERSLLLLDMAGGWPGGAMAQQALRHKTSKPLYQCWFWLAAAVNSALLTGYWLLGR